MAKPSYIRRKWFKLIENRDHKPLMKMLWSLEVYSSNFYMNTLQLMENKHYDYIEEKRSKQSTKDDVTKYAMKKVIKPTKNRRS